MLEDYAVKNGFPNPLHFTDDGISGTRFDRPSFTAMMEEVEAGRVDTIIVKDMSRLGRDYLKVGQIMEILRQKGIRLIAINDGVDSDKGDDDFIPFRNIMNDMFSRDISKKVLAGCMARSRQGRFCGGPSPYGYIRDPADNGHLIIDHETAPTVKLIYDLALDGCGTMKISKQLLERKIPITRCSTAKTDVNYYSWGAVLSAKSLEIPCIMVLMWFAKPTKRRYAPTPTISFLVMNGKCLRIAMKRLSPKSIFSECKSS